MELRAAEREEIATLRGEKLATTFRVPLLPSFHAHLALHADPYHVLEGASPVGYVLVLREPHEGHDHVTLIEGYLTAPYRDRYEDLLDLVQEKMTPSAYLARSDDCTFATAMIAQGLPMEASSAVMVARASYAPPSGDGLALVPLDYAHLHDAHDLLVHVSGVQQAPTYSELETQMETDRLSVIARNGETVGLVVQEAGHGGRYQLLDIVAPHLDEASQVWALQTAGRVAEADGLTPAAVVDSRDHLRRDIFRSAGYYTAAEYLVFYDPDAGRPSVPTIEREALMELIESEAGVHVVDVMGEDHWRAGHLPTATWVDFRSLTREARKRFKKNEPIVVYCNDYT